MKISIFGTGYVGLVTGACFAEMGHDVICADIDVEKIKLLSDGHCPIYEPGLQQLMQKHLLSQKLQFTTDTQKAVINSDLLFIAVGTPSKDDGSVDLSSVFNVIDAIISNAKNTEKTVIIKSTVPVGTYQQIKIRLVDKPHLKLCSNPEFLREGSAVTDGLTPARIILGVEDFSTEKRLIEIYRPFVKHISDIIVMDPASSEMTKYAANAMLAARISLMNEFTRLCEKTNANIKMVELGIGSDPRIGPQFLKAGLGYGGSCLPKDLRALLEIGRQHNLNLKLISAVEDTNHQQKILFLEKIKKHFSALAGLRITIWGTSFKPDTDDIREAPALFLIQELLKLGAHISIFDPQSAEKAKNLFASKNVEVAHDLYDSLTNASALVVATEWDFFLEPDFDKMKREMKTPVIFDGRNIYSSHNITELGFIYYGVGLT